MSLVLIDLSLMAICRDISANQKCQILWGDLIKSKNLILCSSVMEETTLPKTNLAPALPIETIQQGLADRSFAPRDIRALAHETEFCATPFKSHQLCFLHDWARNFTNHPIEIKDLAMLFQMNVRTVRCNLLHGPLAAGNFKASSSAR
jgi:hypothetical protein